MGKLLPYWKWKLTVEHIRKYYQQRESKKELSYHNSQIKGG
jgi:adenine/guanine phosphoribosyltransferase-like PRPP-binding protein